MDRKTVGIIATIATTLLCGCPGLFLCLGGSLVALGVPFTTTINGQSSVQTFPSWVAYAALGVSLLLILTPIVIGIITLRRKVDRSPAGLPL